MMVSAWLADKRVGRHLDDDALDASRQPGDPFSPKIDYGLYEVTDAPPDNWAKVGESFDPCENLAGDVFKQARVDSLRRSTTCRPRRLHGLTSATSACRLKGL